MVEKISVVNLIQTSLGQQESDMLLKLFTVQKGLT